MVIASSILATLCVLSHGNRCKTDPLGDPLHGLCGSSPRTKKDSVSALVDILSYEGALKMLLDVRLSALRVTGVNGSSSRADYQGSLVVRVRVSERPRVLVIGSTLVLLMR